MPNLNRVFLIGNLTRDPEVRYTPKGNAVCDLGLALNRVYTLEGGERREEVTFVDVTLWGRQAEVAGEYLVKGRAVFIEGRLQLDTWEDRQTGQKRSRLRVVAQAMQLLDRRPSAEGHPTAAGPGAVPDQTAQERIERPERPERPVRPPRVRGTQPGGGPDDLDEAGDEEKVPF